MGAWGYQVFENDDALDWLAELEDADDASASTLTAAFDAVLKANSDRIEIPEASTALAAAEIVTAMLGKATVSLSEEIVEWIEGLGAVQPDMVDKAQAAVRQVMNGSELEQVWKGSSDYQSWAASVEDLLKRLS
jgi:hypothetical protein